MVHGGRGRGRGRGTRLRESRKIELLAERPKLAHVLRGERVRRPLDLPSDLSELGARPRCSVQGARRKEAKSKVQQGATRCKISLTTSTPY